MTSNGFGRNGATSASASRMALAGQVRSLIEQQLFDVVYQSIVDLEEVSAAGCEVLTRPHPSSGFKNPLELFGAAARCGLLFELEEAVRAKTFREAPTWTSSGLLFINNTPQVFVSDGYIESLLEQLETSTHLSPRHVVLEVTEQGTAEALEDLGSRARSLRAMGFQVAIDDVGAGVSGLNQITNIRPDWIKLDRELITDIDRDPFKQNLIRFFVRFTRFGGISLIAEGIERDAELEALIELGVRYAQGYCLGRPSSDEPVLDSDRAESIAAIQTAHHERRLINSGAMRLASLAEPALVLESEILAREAWEKVSLQIHNDGAVVCDGRRFSGWIARAELEAHAHEARPVSALNVIAAGRVSDETTLAEALEIVAQLDGDAQAAPLIVQTGGEIVGAVSLRRLLQTAAQVQRRSAALVRPLAGLPGRMEADRWLSQAIESRRPTDLAFIDIRNFGAYNVSYGDDMGDELLRQFGALLQESNELMKSRNAYLSHLGEDRFMLAHSGNVEQALQHILRKFATLIPEFHTAEDIAQGDFSFTGANHQAERRSLVRPRIVYLKQPFIADPPLRSPYELYQRVRSLRMSGDGQSIIYDRRQEGSRRRVAG